MDKYEVLQERPKKTFRIAFSGTAYITAHCELEAKAILQGITFNEIPFRAIDSIRELDEDEETPSYAVS